MITGDELLKDLESIKKKSELVTKTFPNNTLWKDVDTEIGTLISTIKKDKRIYSY